MSVDLESLLSGTSTTATPAAAQICCSGSRISSALVLVSFLSSSSDARSVCSLNSASSRSLATTSASRTHAATASSRVLNACVWRYATAHAFQTAFQLLVRPRRRNSGESQGSERPFRSVKRSFSILYLVLLETGTLVVDGNCMRRQRSGLRLRPNQRADSIPRVEHRFRHEQAGIIKGLLISAWVRSVSDP